MEIINISVFRQNIFKTIEAVLDFGDPVTISTKKGNAVLLPESDYRSLLETIAVLSDHELVEKIKRGEKEDPSTMAVFDPEDGTW